MEVAVLDENFNTIYVIDDYISLLWVERYYEAGEFELVMAPKENFLDDMYRRVRDIAYLRIRDSDRVMILDTIEITTDPETGGRLKLTGKSLEIILDRRIYWEGFKLWKSQELSSFLWYCLQYNVTAPTDPARKIPNFRYSEKNWPSMGKHALTTMKEYSSETIYEMISEQCKFSKYGFKVILASDNWFEFVLYKGVDRTPKGSQSNYVIVSPKYDNLSESNYLSSSSDYRNTALIEAKGQAENERIFKVKTKGDLTYSGLARREVYTDGTDISWNRKDYTGLDSDNKNLLTNEEFQAMMFEAGATTLEEHTHIVAFEGIIEPNVSFVYGEDYNLGDIVYIVDKYGAEGSGRITEVTKSYNASGNDISFTLEDQEPFN